MNNEIIILCNSAACLDEISSGRFVDLHTRNIFTCNDAYAFFRTTGKHFNFVSDMPHVALHANNPGLLKPWGGYDHIQFIYSAWDIKRKAVNVFPGLTYSPIEISASSAINALFYLNAVEKFDSIILVGYTINEWDGMDKFPNLKKKKEAFDVVFKNYSMEQVRKFVYEFSRK
jgi:hypothetical protein